MSARVLSVLLRPHSGAPVQLVERAEAVAGRGLVGDHSRGGKRQLTLLDVTRWAEVCRDLGSELPASARRANVLVEGLSLDDAIGRRLRVGPVLVEIVGETVPCRLMDDTAPGLYEALRPSMRGGVFGRIVEGGEVAVGHAVDFVGP